MKKIYSFIFCTILCALFSITASALEDVEDFKVNIRMSDISSDFQSVPAFASSYGETNELGNTLYYMKFAGYRDNGTTWYYIFRFTSDDFVYDADAQTLSKLDGSYFEFYFAQPAVDDGEDYVSGASVNTVRTKSIKLNGSVIAENLVKNCNMHIKNLERFDPQMPPDVFTYSVDKNNFSLQNGEQGVFNVTISYTEQYIDWVRQVREKLLPDFNGSYNFLLYVSKTRAVDIESLKQSLQDMSYVKLTYNDYYTAQQDDYTAYTWLNDDDYMLNRGADLVFTFDPLKQQSITIPCLSENIQGEQAHVDGFVTVLGAYCEGKLNPDCFGLSWIEKTLNELYKDNTGLSVAALNGDVAPNDRYVYYTYDDDKNVLMRQFFVPYDLIGTYKCDLYNGGYTYKLQTVNGKDYITPTDTAQKPSPEFQQHSSFEDKNTWLAPEDARKYYNEWLKKNQYNEDFDFNGETFKDVFSKEGDFFKFIGAALSVFPSYVMDIFVAFLVGMLVVVLLKFIL